MVVDQILMVLNGTAASQSQDHGRVFNGVSSLIRNWCLVACIKAQVLVNGRDRVELAEV